MLQSRYTTKANAKIDFPMSRKRYLSSWKIFRAISDENIVTASHILSLPAWGDVSSVVDFGCGDGLITKALVLKSPQNIDKITLVDPDTEMLLEADIHLKEIGLVPDLRSVNAKFEDCVGYYTRDADVILAIHLVYLLSEESFKLLIDSLPVGKKMIVILDEANSIFSRLWEFTAPKYARRSEIVRNYLGSQPAGLSIEKSLITSKIISPLIARQEIKSALLSLLSYSDYSLMTPEVQNKVENTVSESLNGRFAECTSACYQITRLS